MIISIGVVPAVLASIVAIIVTVLCTLKKRWLIDYKLKQSVMNNTEEYIKRLQEQIKNENRPKVLEELIKLMTVASERLLNPDGIALTPAPDPVVPCVTISTQTSLICSESTNQVKQEPTRVVNDSNDLNPEEVKVVQQPRVSFQRNESMKEMEPIDLDHDQSSRVDNLTNLFAVFISKAVHDSLLGASEHNPRLACKVEKEVRRAMFQRQQSIASSGTSYAQCDCSCKCCERHESEC